MFLYNSNSPLAYYHTFGLLLHFLIAISYTFRLSFITPLDHHLLNFWITVCSITRLLFIPVFTGFFSWIEFQLSVKLQKGTYSHSLLRKIQIIGGWDYEVARNITEDSETK